jgi:putative membrane protein
VPPGYYVHAHHGHPFLWLVLFLLFLALIAFALYSLFRLTRGGGTAAPAAATPAGDAALESVRMRYARGEIDRDEFIRLSTDLGAPPPVTA